MSNANMNSLERNPNSEQLSQQHGPDSDGAGLDVAELALIMNHPLALSVCYLVFFLRVLVTSSLTSPGPRSAKYSRNIRGGEERGRGS